MPGARDALESSLKLAPSQISARLLLGRVYLQLKRREECGRPVRGSAAGADSSNSDGRMGTGGSASSAIRFAGALPDLEAFTKSDPRNAVARRLLARAYRGLEEHDVKRAEEKAAALGKK